ncbi:hypothetical protein ACFPRL_16895 [Pseudoclavibacter helvolus]
MSIACTPPQPRGPHQRPKLWRSALQRKLNRIPPQLWPAIPHCAATASPGSRPR